MKTPFLLILLGTILWGFTIGIWQSGTTLKKSIHQAQKHNLPLISKDYISHVNQPKGFDTAYLQNTQKLRTFLYEGELWGEKATYTLYFSQSSQRLYKLNIRWIHPTRFNIHSKKEFEQMLISKFTQKYGNHRKVVDTRDSFHQYKKWSIDANNTLLYKNALYHNSISYINHPLKSKHIQELKKSQNKKKIHFIMTERNTSSHQTK